MTPIFIYIAYIVIGTICIVRITRNVDRSDANMLGYIVAVCLWPIALIVYVSSKKKENETNSKI